MNVKNDISEELGSLSALVASISRETPYRAPEGYFLRFPTAALERVQADLSHVAGLPTGKPLTFSVPEGYFDGFAQQVLNRIKTGVSAGSAPSAGRREEEAAEPAAGPELLPHCLIEAGRITPYRVPEGYFDGLSPILSILKDKNPYLVPAGYFDELAPGILARATEQPELSKQPELSRSVVIAGADSNSRLEMTKETHSRPGVRVISLGKRLSWMKYAAAAVVAGLIVSVGWLRWSPVTSRPSAPQDAAITPSGTSAEIATNLSKVSDAELQSYLVDQDTTLAQPVGNIGNAGTMATVDMDDSELVDMNDTGLKTLLGNVTDGELKQYMDEHGGASDIATN